MKEFVAATLFSAPAWSGSTTSHVEASGDEVSVIDEFATVPAPVRPFRNAALRLLDLVPAVRRGMAEQLSAIGPR